MAPRQVLMILATIVIGWLVVQEFRLYFKSDWSTELVLDKERSDRMEITMDITFPNLPCSLLSVDTMDVSGEVQEHMDRQLQMQDLDASGNPVDPKVIEEQRRVRDDAIAARKQNPDYKGECYGALPDSESCDTCDDVRRAYAAKNWQFHDGSGFQQCIEEHYSEFVEANKNNGCRVFGSLTVQKVVGNVHFAPGESFFVNERHSHDLSAYYLENTPYSFTHTINKLSFGGNDISDEQDKLLEDPLKGYKGEATSKSFVFRYFAKIVPTHFVTKSGEVHHSNQYSVTTHERALSGGRDADHPNTYHGVGGMPGIWLNYDISPMLVINRFARKSSMVELVMNLCSIIGAVVTTAAVLEGSFQAVNRAWQERKNR